MSNGWIIASIVGGVLACRIALSAIDRKRIHGFVRALGGRVSEITWSPFGPGWSRGPLRSRGYRVYYIDSSGREHKAFCYTAILRKVSFAHDELVPSDNVESPPIARR